MLTYSATWDGGWFDDRLQATTFSRDCVAPGKTIIDETSIIVGPQGRGKEESYRGKFSG